MPPVNESGEGKTVTPSMGEEGRAKWHILGEGPLEGEHWSARLEGPDSLEVDSDWRRPWRWIEYLGGLRRIFSRPRKRKNLLGILGLLILAFAFSIWFVFFHLAESERKAGQEALPQVPGLTPGKGPEIGGKALAERHYFETWYLLTRVDEAGGLKIRATFETPEKLAREVQAKAERENWPADRQQTELRKAKEGGPFDHNLFYYFHLNLEALAGSLPPRLLEDPYSLVHLEDDGGRQAKALAPPGLEDRKATFAASGDGPQSEAIRGASFYVAFPRDRFSLHPRYLRLRFSWVRGGRDLALTWNLPIPYPSN